MKYRVFNTVTKQYVTDDRLILKPDGRLALNDFGDEIGIPDCVVAFCPESEHGMSINDLNVLFFLLDRLKKCLPCSDGPCSGYQHCEFGENGCYGERCSVDDVINAISYYMPDIIKRSDSMSNTLKDYHGDSSI